MTAKEIKEIKSLSQKKFRDESGLFVVEGEKMVAEARKSGFEIVSIYRKDEIGEEAMSRISALSSPSPVLAVVRQKHSSICLEGLEKGLYLALDSIRDPGNLGTIIRIADWFGIKAILASADTVELYNPKVVQATMGAIFRVPVIYCDLQEVSRSAHMLQGRIYGTFLDGEDIYSKTLTCGADAPDVIVIGNESNGISEGMAQMVTDRLYIPPFPADAQTSESLNAAVATAITVAEFRRISRKH